MVVSTTPVAPPVVPTTQTPVVPTMQTLVVPTTLAVPTVQPPVVSTTQAPVVIVPTTQIPVAQTQSLNRPMVSLFRVPVPWDRNSPSFNGKTAEDLLKFLRHVQAIIDEGGIVGEQEKMEQMMSYLKVTLQEEWKGLETYNNGTYQDFIDEIQTMYLEIHDLETGSIERLQQLCGQYTGLSYKQWGVVKCFGVSFKTEGKKLLHPPVVVTNRELVQLYLSRLTPEFSEEVKKLIM
ncbi:hypothetical protein B0H10DRAFT_1973778 [Mycena sp. CBHHK59/15]|nr:hypothetical protein B0H10DRAFT_1973778 [Mycena sp. CBHHK59/15]